MKRPQLVSAGSLNRMLQSAAEAWNRREFAEAIELMQRARRLDPANVRLLLDLGGLMGKRYDYAGAQENFERAIRLTGNKAETIFAAGQKAREFGNYELARTYFSRAVEGRDAPLAAYVQLAEVHERLRQTDAARDIIERALQRLPGAAPALLVRARLDRQAGRIQEAEAELRALIPKAAPDVRAGAWYELGALLDREGRYDDAMAAFLEAKAVLRPDAANQSARLRVMRDRLRQLRESLTPEIIGRWVGQSSELQPPRRIALLCGHPRSGTTLLEQVLDSHDQMISAEETEIFHDDAYMPLARGDHGATPMLQFLENATPDALRASRANYFRSVELFLGKPLAGRMVIDKNPSLTYLTPLFTRIFPEGKFLVALRDPRDICLSCFMQPFVPLGMTSSAYMSLETTVAEYADLMGMWRKMASLRADNGITVRYEDMVADLESVARRVLAFLDVPWDEKVLAFHQHARAKMVRSPTYADVTQPVFKRAVGRWRNYQKCLEPHLPVLEPFVKAFGYE